MVRPQTKYLRKPDIIRGNFDGDLIGDGARSYIEEFVARYYPKEKVVSHRLCGFLDKFTNLNKI